MNIVQHMIKEDDRRHRDSLRELDRLKRLAERGHVDAQRLYMALLAHDKSTAWADLLVRFHGHNSELGGFCNICRRFWLVPCQAQRIHAGDRVLIGGQLVTVTFCHASSNMLEPLVTIKAVDKEGQTMRHVCTRYEDMWMQTDDQQARLELAVEEHKQKSA